MSHHYNHPYRPNHRPPQNPSTVKSPFVHRLEYGVVISGTMVVERMSTSSSFDSSHQLAQQQQQQQPQQQQQQRRQQSPTKQLQQQVTIVASPPSRQVEFASPDQSSSRQQTPQFPPPYQERYEESQGHSDEDGAEGEDELSNQSGGEYGQHRMTSSGHAAVRQPSSSSLRRAILVRQDAELPQQAAQQPSTVVETDNENSAAGPSPVKQHSSASSSRQQSQTTAVQQSPPSSDHHQQRHQQQQSRQHHHQPPQQQQTVIEREPPRPSPSPVRIPRGQTPVCEFEEPDDLFFIVKELVLTERTYLRDLELAAVRLPGVLMSFSRHHSPGSRPCPGGSASGDPLSDSERSCVSESTSGGSAATGLGCLCSFASSTLHPLLNFHRAFASELESRLCAWTASCSAVNESSSIERVSSQRQAIILQIGDILMSLTTVLHLYRSYLARLLSLLWSPVVGADLTMLTEVLAANTSDPNLAAFYISPALLLCRPAHRLLAYRHLLATYVAHLSPTHPDSLDASALLARLSDLLAGSASVLGRVDSARILLELRASLPGQSAGSPTASHAGPLAIPLAACSDFVRLGCLHKLTRKGYQPRLFLLLSDSLLYAARSSIATSGNSGASSPIFRLHSQIPLRELSMVGNSENEPGRLQLVEMSTGRRLHLIATSVGDWRRWLADLRATISMASAGTTASSSLPRRRHNQSGQAALTGSIVDSMGTLSANVSPPLIVASEASSTSPEANLTQHLTMGACSPRYGELAGIDQQQQMHQSSGCTGSGGGVSVAHVCWHRALSIGVDDVRLAGSGAQLSSYLLRKFKSAPGWQKLWVVLAADCALHFFKSCYDPTPLASLPLLGYSVAPVPTGRAESPASQYQQQLVFRLQFKSHVYLFRAESRYTYGRWMEAIRCATLAWWTAEQCGGSDNDGNDEAAAAAAYILQQEENEAMYGEYMQEELEHEQQA